jgi:hypothetical protein
MYGGERHRYLITYHGQAKIESIAERTATCLYSEANPVIDVNDLYKR